MSEPPITIRAYHDSGAQTIPVTRIVIHDEECAVSPGSAESIANYFASAGAGGSAHYLTDADSEQHCVPDGVIAWHAPPNNGSIGIEQDGYASFSRADWLADGSKRTLSRTAARTAELVIRFNIPVQKIGPQDLLNGAHGICGHVDVSQAWHQSDHSDPGTGFPWDLFLPLVALGVSQLHDVRTFQAAHGLTADGDPGIKTVLALGDYLYGKFGIGTPPPPPAPSNTNRFASYPTLQLGSRDSGSTNGFPDRAHPVATAQNALNICLGTEVTGKLGADGDFGPATKAKVISFQLKYHLSGDGVVGPNTWAKLDAVLDAKKR